MGYSLGSDSKSKEIPFSRKPDESTTGGCMPDPDIDAKATRLGNKYRGIGIFIGILGILIIFFAVTANAPGIHGVQATVIGLTEFALMVAMLAILWYCRDGKLRRDWIDARRTSEKLRYRGLQCCIEGLQKPIAEEESPVKTLNECLAILAGTNGQDGQIAYNKKKYAQYERIEFISDRVAWSGFFVGVIAAFAHLFLHAWWLIYFTACLPAAIGVIHGINSFLQIGSLADEHELMAHRLTELLEDFQKPDSSRSAFVLEKAKILYDVLNNRDVRWMQSTKKMNTRPA